MRREEVWWINFDPSVGGEIQKKRPAIIVSNDIANRLLNRIQVIPLTTNVNRVYPAEAIVSINQEKCKAMVDQLTTVSKQRILNKLGEISQIDLRKIEQIIAIQLGLKLEQDSINP